MRRIVAGISLNFNSIEDWFEHDMKLVEINWNPTVRQLRQFGVISLVVLPFVGWLWNAEFPVIGGLAAAGVVLAVVACVLPRLLKPVFLGLMLVSLPIGLVVGELALLLIYFGAFLPIGLAFRILKRDGLELKRDRQATTFWRAKQQPCGPATYYHQY